MTLVTVPKQKAQFNIDLDDALLSHQIDATVAHVASLIGAPLTEPLPAPIRQAVLLLAACCYEAREAAQSGRAPQTHASHVPGSILQVDARRATRGRELTFCPLTRSV